MDYMNIEVEATITYTVSLDKEDIKKIKNYIEKHKDELPSYKMENNIAWAVQQLYNDDEIDLYESGKAVESDFCTEDISWSSFEHRSAEEILNSV